MSRPSKPTKAQLRLLHLIAHWGSAGCAYTKYAVSLQTMFACYRRGWIAKTIDDLVFVTPAGRAVLEEHRPESAKAMASKHGIVLRETKDRQDDLDVLTGKGFHEE